MNGNILIEICLDRTLTIAEVPTVVDISSSKEEAYGMSCATVSQTLRQPHKCGSRGRRIGLILKVT